MKNESGFEPLGRAVLVTPYEAEEVTRSSLIIPKSAQDRMNALEQRAIVVAIGPACWPEEPPRCSVGDHVLISKMAGYPADGPADGKPYRFINDRDVFARIVKKGDSK